MPCALTRFHPFGFGTPSEPVPDRWRAAGSHTGAYRRTYAHIHPDDDECLIIPRRQWTPTNNNSSSPNVGYVLMDPIQTSAASFGRVCAVAPSVYGKPSPPFLHAPISLTELLSLKRFRIVRAPRVPSALEEYVSQCLCVFCLSAMPLPLPLCPYQDSWPGYQPRFVVRPPTSTLHLTPFPQSLTHRPGSSCDRDVIHGPVHSHRLCVVLPDDHPTFLIG